MIELLINELKTYRENFESILGSHEGKFVLIYEDKILGAFDSQMDAISWGYRELGNVPFLVKHAVKVEAPFNFYFKSSGNIKCLPSRLNY